MVEQLIQIRRDNPKEFIKFQKEILKEVLSDKEFKKFFMGELLKDEDFKRELFKDVSFRMGRRNLLVEGFGAGIAALGIASFIGKAGATTVVTEKNVIIDNEWFYPIPLPVSAIIFINDGNTISLDYKGYKIDKGLNIIDDTAIMQNTLDYIPDGAKIFVAKGVYYINQTLSIDKHNITICGEKGGRCKDGKPTSKLKLTASTNMFEFTNENQAGITFRDIVLSGNQRSYNTTIIYASKVDRFTFENVMFCNHAGICIHAKECNDWVLDNVMVYRCGSYDLGESMIQIDRPESPRENGACLDWKLINVLVEESFGRFITAYDQSGERTIEDWDLTNCKIHGLKSGSSQWEALLLDNVCGLTITGGQISYHKNLIKITNSKTERIKFLGVKFYNNQYYTDYDIIIQEGRLITINGCSFKMLNSGKVHVLFGENANCGNSVVNSTWSHDTNLQVLVDNESNYRVIVRNCWRNDKRGYENRGVDVFNGTSSDDTFVNSDHGLVDNPTDSAMIICHAVPQSPDAQAAGPVAAYPADNDSDGNYESLKFVFSSAPKIGTDNVKLSWFAELII